MKWICCRFNELTNHQIWEMYHIRAETFCVQQQRTFVDADKEDLTAHHVLGFNEHDELVAYARFYEVGAYLDFGRVLTVPAVRGKGIGKQLMEYLMQQIERVYPGHREIIITAQADKQGFYERFGFVPQGDVFIHEQTPHIKMIRK
ncbi:GNAT family N-acetyltransferase [Nicoliella spurrieriana]|uniref:GNAT family N-acetyltransferase n=1 Tax=Nicoliella spurrieriana TaxID=2925830 RepID=A0A976RTA1_9LACO|nr:GNAT family N-acetyltransferase [Nicoliella spurrieriana]UQS87279.1 GNAT family N-acetyltransferase [Nicoliella spurrieriana]